MSWHVVKGVECLTVYISYGDTSLNERFSKKLPCSANNYPEMLKLKIFQFP